MKPKSISSFSKFIFFSFAIALSLAPNDSSADVSIPVDFNFADYMRSGTGDNDKGGKQVCFNNIGGVANEFRLGNECGTYGEASFHAVMLKPKNADDPFFRSQLTFAYFPPNDSQYEDTTVAGEHDINVVEAYIAGGNFSEFQCQLWAGKRFYRMNDIHMNDFYFFDNMNGTGGGIQKLKTAWGLFNVALLRESTFAQPGLPPAGLTTPTQTRVDSASAGILGKSAIDARLDIPLTEFTTLSVWGVAAYSPPGSGTVETPGPTAPVTTATYESGRGYVAGLYARHRFETDGFNDLAVAYGTGIMQVLEMGNGYGSRGTAGVIDGSGGNNASRLRIIESFTHSFNERWATHAAITFEDRNSGAATDPHSRWWNVGVRPYYSLSEHFSLVAELGHSEVADDSDRDPKGNRIAARQLTRITFAPQFAIKSDIMARPVLRLFFSQTFWNDANQRFVNNGTTLSVSPTPAYITSLSGSSVGVQGEVWF